MLENLVNTIEKEVVFKLNAITFEAIVCEVYGKTDFSIAENEELMNDVSQEYNIKKFDLSGYDQKKLEDFIEGDSKYITQVLFQDLVNKDILEEGSYIVNVSW